MIRLPKRLAGMMPLLTHRTTVAGDTSSSFATSFVVKNVFFMLNLNAIYTSNESYALTAASDSRCYRIDGSGLAGCFQSDNLFPFVFPF